MTIGLDAYNGPNWSSDLELAACNMPHLNLVSAIAVQPNPNRLPGTRRDSIPIQQGSRELAAIAFLSNKGPGKVDTARMDAEDNATRDTVAGSS